MQKKLIALAIAAAFSAPAFADNANVTFYGKLIADVESVKSDKSTIPPFTAPATGASYTANRVVSDASRFGLKGEDDLGEGLKAFFQVETQVELGGGSATFTSVRNSGAGLKGESWGSVMIANWDTPYKLTHNKIELFDNTTFASATTLIGRSAAVGAVALVNTAASSDHFVTRQAGVVQYYSPKFSGFDVKVAYAPATDTYAVANNASTKQNKAVFSTSGTFENEFLYVAAGYESHGDQLTPTATRATGSNTAARVVGAYTIVPGLMVGATVERLSISQANLAGTGVDKNSRTGAELMASYKTGANNFGISYAKQGNLGSATNTGAKQVSLRYGFDFSKRTQLFVMFSQLSNDTAGQYAMSAQSASAIASAPGATYSGIGAGLQHSF
jgi:predicted porin